MPESKLVTNTVRLSQDFDSLVKKKLIDIKPRKLSFQELVERFLREWVGGARDVPGALQAERGSAHPSHQKLDFILLHGDARDRSGIERSLEWAVTSIEAATGATAPDSRHEVYARVDRANDAIALSIKSLMKEWVAKHPETEHGETKTRTEGSVKHSGRKAG